MSSRIKLAALTPAPLLDEPMPLERALKWIATTETRIKLAAEIFFAQSAYRKCVAHATRDLEHEVGGVLVGEACTDSARGKTYIRIEDILPALFTDSSETHVTFTQNTLVHLNNQLLDLFPGKRMVGWYHTHPRFGVFLSGHDAWIQRHFFNDAAHVALVIDPYYHTAGFFGWQANQVLDTARYVGFYEWSDLSDESIVEWHNLAPVVADWSVDASERGSR